MEDKPADELAGSPAWPHLPPPTPAPAHHEPGGGWRGTLPVPPLRGVGASQRGPRNLAALSCDSGLVTFEGGSLSHGFAPR